MIKTVRAHHTGPGLRFEISTGSGHQLVVDDEVGDTGPRPAEVLLAAQAGCTALDVASILAKKRQTVTSYAVVVTGEQRDDPHPHVFRRIDILHELSGPSLDTSAVRRAIELSATRYCMTTATLSAGPAEIHHRYLVHRTALDGAAGVAESGEVVVTGPRADFDGLGQTPDQGTVPSV